MLTLHCGCLQSKVRSCENPAEKWEGHTSKALAIFLHDTQDKCLMLTLTLSNFLTALYQCSDFNTVDS